MDRQQKNELKQLEELLHQKQEEYLKQLNKLTSSFFRMKDPEKSDLIAKVTKLRDEVEQLGNSVLQIHYKERAKTSAELEKARARHSGNKRNEHKTSGKIACEKCNGTGWRTSTGWFSPPCPSCGGSGFEKGSIWSKCSHCGGNGKSNVPEHCPDCNGSGKVWS